MHPLHKDLFDKIDNCVQNISDIERATSAFYHLMSNTPSGKNLLIVSIFLYRGCVARDFANYTFFVKKNVLRSMNIPF